MEEKFSRGYGYYGENLTVRIALCLAYVYTKKRFEGFRKIKNEAKLAIYMLSGGRASLVNF